MSKVKSCLLCENYNTHPCKCEHCEDWDNFHISESGKALREKIYGDGYQDGYKDGYDKGYDDAQANNNRPQNGWILVSKRLPKDEDYRPCYGLPDGCVMWQTDNGVIGFGWYYDSTKCWSDIYDHPITAGKVIAWQPLPESYKKGGAEE